VAAVQSGPPNPGPPSRPPPPGPGRSLASPPAPLHLQSRAWCVCSGRAKGPLLGAAPPGGSPATGSVDRPLLRLGAAAPPGVTRIADHSCPGLLVKRGQHHATSDRASFAQCASFRSESTWRWPSSHGTQSIENVAFYFLAQRGALG